MNEHSFIRSIHRKLPRGIYHWKIRDSFSNGVPDCYYEGPKGSLWVEYKYIKKLPSRNSSKVTINLSELQKNWIQRAVTNNQNCAVVVGTNENLAIFKNGDWTFRITKEYYLRISSTKDSLVDYITETVI